MSTEYFTVNYRKLPRSGSIKINKYFSKNTHVPSTITRNVAYVSTGIKYHLKEEVRLRKFNTRTLEFY